MSYYNNAVGYMDPSSYMLNWLSRFGRRTDASMSPPSTATVPTNTTRPEVYTIDSTDSNDPNAYKFHIGNQGLGTDHWKYLYGGLRSQAPNAHLTVISLEKQDMASLYDSLLEMNKRVKPGDIVYIPLSIQSSMQELGSLIGRPNMSVVEFHQAMPAIRAAITNYTGDSTAIYWLQKYLPVVEEIAQRAKVFISSDNKPEVMNAMVMAQGNNITTVGSLDGSTSPIYDVAVHTSYDVQRIEGGLDVCTVDTNGDGIGDSGDGIVDLKLNPNDDGYDMQIGSRKRISNGGSSLGVAIAAGQYAAKLSRMA